MANIPEAMESAVQHHRAGRLPEAETIYRQVLATDPNHSGAWHLLGVIAHQVGRHDVAVTCLQEAIRLNATEPALHNMLGVVFRAQGKLDQAVVSYRRALHLKPDMADALNNLGNACKDLGRLDEAVASYRRALELNPGAFQTHNSLGDVWQSQGNIDEAVASFRRAVDINPNYAEAHNNLGNALRKRGELDAAIACYQRALELNPSVAEPHNNLGTARIDQGRLEEAIGSFQRALQLKPDFAEAHVNLGKAFGALRNIREAVACFQRAIKLKPDLAEAHYSLGMAWQGTGRLDDSAASLQRALELKPDFTDALFALGAVRQEQSQFDEVIACTQRLLALKPDHIAALAVLVHALQYSCRWDGIMELSRRISAAVDERGDAVPAVPVPPFSFLSLPTVTTGAQQLRCARQWVDRQLQVPIELGRRRALKRVPTLKSRPTIGYLSGDFRAHPGAYAIVELLEKHDRDRFMVHGYSYGPDDGSPIRKRIVNAVDRFVDLENASFADAAERINADEVDILVDLRGYTRNGRTGILAFRPAPIQVNYLGYPGTTAAPFMDYIVVDDFVVPAEQQPLFTERLVHLPGCYMASDSQREISERTPSREACGLPEAGFVFCAFNNSCKITPEVFNVWMQFLKDVPGSVLWLREWNRFVAPNLRREAEARGVNADRLVFAASVPLAEHLARHRLADLFLDTFPYTAHTMASDALWAGCPILTIIGETYVTRAAGSLLHTLGLPELITRSRDEYRDMGLRLARDPDMLNALRERLAVNRRTSSLFDGGHFARKLERAFLTMREIYNSGEPPRGFAVSPP